MGTTHSTKDREKTAFLNFLDESGREDEDFAYCVLTEEGKRLRKFLSEEQYRIKDTEQTYRLVNHWSSLGLIADIREKKGGWRKFSAVDLVWIQVIAELRAFGFPLESIQEAKRKLLGMHKVEEVAYNVLEVALILTVFKKREMFIIVPADGDASPIAKELLEAHNRCSLLPNYISINLNEIAQRIFKKVDLLPIFDDVQHLHDNEKLLLLEVRSGRFDSIKVTLRGGEIEMIESEEAVDAQKRIIEILKEADYQDITVRKNDGKVVSIKRTIKTKPHKNATGHTRASSTKLSRPSNVSKSGAGTSTCSPSNNAEKT